MEEKAMVQAIDDKIAKLMEENAEKEIEGTKGKLKWYQALGNAVLSSGNVILNNELNQRTARKNAEKHEREYNESLEALMAKRAEILSTGKSADGSTELTEAEKAEIAAAEEEKARKEAADKAAAQRVENAKKALEQLEGSHKQELVALKRQMIEKGETKEWYNNQALLKELEYLTQKSELQATAGEDTLKTDEQILDNQLKLRENYQKNIEDINNTISELEEETFDLPEPDMEGFEEEYQKSVEALDRYKELKEKFKTDEESQAEQFTAELTDLKDAYELGIISHEDYEKRKADITKKYTGKGIETYKKYLDAVGGIVNGLGDMFSAQKEAELAEAGDNAQKKEAIEKKYAKKQQAIAKTQAAISAAQAIIQLWAQPSVIPEPANSIYKGVMSALIGATTLAQMKKINSAQFKSGGFTARDDSDSKPAGVVHTNEWVASAPLLRNPETRRHIDYLENVQRGIYPRFNTASVSAASRGFATGGYTTPPTPGETTTTEIREVIQTDPALISTMQQMTLAANRLAEKELLLSMSELNTKSEQYKQMQNSVNLRK
jgi:hypothetical protein